jgi:POT family proton-dependent oligopeptide transporter
MSTAPARQRTLFGHPAGLAVLFGTEMWERFCYYGNSALITYYLVDFLFVGARPQTIIGYGAVKTTLESLYGPLAAQPLAALVVGAVSSATYLSGLAGGAIADRYLGQTRSVMLGAITMAAGEFLLINPDLLFVALLVFIAGVGLLKPNIAIQVGGLYEPGDARIDRAFSIFYIGINLGALIAPIICGRLGHAAPGEPPRWQYGFGAAGIGMLIGLAVLLIGLRYLPPDVRARRRAAEQTRHRAGEAPANTRLTQVERRTVAALFLVAFCNLFFWGCYGQQYSTIALMAENYTNLTLGPITFHPEDVQAFNPFFIFTLTPVVIAIWSWQSRRGREPAPVTKMAIGCAGTALCFGLLIIPALAMDRGAHVSIVWLMAAMALQTMGELYLMPVALSLFSRAAPPKLASIMMAVNYLSLAVGFYISGYLAHFWSGMGKAAFFTMIAGIAAATSVGIFGLSRVLNPVLKET